MKDPQPSFSTTCFRLRAAPLGFAFDLHPTVAPERVARRNSAAEAAALPAHQSRSMLPARGPARTRWVGLAVFALLALHATLAWTASLQKGQSFDEGLQLAIGYNIWRNDDLRIEGANGDLVKRWATLPYLISQPNFVGQDDRFWKTGAPYELAHEFFFLLGNQPEMLLAQARAMIALLSFATGLVVFLWARALFGATGGLVSLTLFTFSPHMLAFGGIVSTDMSITLTLCAATWSIWRLLHRISLARIVGGLAIFGALVLAKPTALVILPVTAILIAVRLIAGEPLQLEFFRRSWTLSRRGGQAVAICAMIVLHAAAGWGAIWAHYSFRYTASPQPGNPELKMPTLQRRDGVAEPLRKTLRWLQETRVLPQGFHRGVHSLVGNDDETVSFMNGSWAIGGRPEFFPYTMWVKTSPLLTFLLLGAAGAWLWSWRRPSHRTSHETANRHAAPSLYALAPLFILPLCYLAIAAAEDLNIGHRHILPIYPVFYVLAGAVTLGLQQRGRRWQGALIGLVLCGVAAESFAMRPDYLAYVSPQAGGSADGYKRLVDSSLDWGMELPTLKRWRDEHDPQERTPLFLAYFGTDNPTYHGIRARRLPGFFDNRPVEAYPLFAGYYAVSATLLQSLYTPAVGPWRPAYEQHYRFALQRMRVLEARPGDRTQETWFQPEGRKYWIEMADAYDGLRFGRLCAWLRHRRAPDYALGHSLLIWKLSFDDLHAALLGPPVELVDEPAPARRYSRFMPLPE